MYIKNALGSKPNVDYLTHFGGEIELGIHCQRPKLAVKRPLEMELIHDYHIGSLGGAYWHKPAPSRF